MKMQMFKHPTWVALVVSLGVGISSSPAATVAHWNFDQGTPGAPFTMVESGGEASVPDLSGNGYWMWAWNSTFGPSYSLLGETPSGAGLSSRHVGQVDGYTVDAGINTWSPSVWTIEVAVKLDLVNGWRTIIGRDGSSDPNVGQNHPANKADFYLQKSGDANTFRVDFRTADGSQYLVDSNFQPLADQWYGLAIVSDGSAVTMFADKLDGLGWQSVGSTALTGVNNALATTGAAWTFGRGWYNGSFVDGMTGNLDNIRFSDMALSPSEFLPVPEPSSLALAGLGGLAWLLRRRMTA